MSHASAAGVRQPAPSPSEEGKPREVSDRQLLERFVVNRDEAAFADLVRQYSGSVWAVCRRLLHHTQDAEDAFQAVFFLLAKKAAAIRKREAVGSWLYGVAYRTAMKAKRTAARRRQAEAGALVPDAGASPPSEAACRELQRLLDEEVQRLPDKFRTPFVLCCLQGLSKAEAAVELGWKEGTVSGRMTQARQLLHKRLSRRGVSLSAVLTALMLTHDAAATAAPVALVHGTVQAVLSSVAGHTAAALTPAAVTLANGVLRTVALAKLKAGAILLLTLTMVGVGGVEVALQDAAPAQENANPGMVQDTEVQPVQPPPEAIDEQVLALAFSLDGKRLFTAGARHLLPGQLKIWDVATGKELAKERGMPGIRTVALSPDGRTLACGHFGGVITFRDTQTGKEQSQIKAHAKGVNGLAYSADGTLLVSAGLDKLVKLWDVKARRPVQVFRGHTDMVFSAAFFRHGRAVVTAGKDADVRVWDVRTGTPTFVLHHRDGVEMVAISPDDRIVATASWDGEIRFWDPQTGRQTATLGTQGDALLAIAFSPDGKLLASATAGGAIRVWDVKQRNVPVGSFGSHRESVWALAFSPDGKLLASGSSDKTAKLWDVSILASPRPGTVYLALAATALVANAGSVAGSMPLAVMAGFATRPPVSPPRTLMPPVMVLNASEAVLPRAVPPTPAGKKLTVTEGTASARPADEPTVGQAGELKHEAYYDFRGRPLPPELTLFEDGDGHFPQIEAEGLRMTLPKVRNRVADIGVRTVYGMMDQFLHGDFEITTTFEILAAEAPGSGFGVGLALGLGKADSREAANVFRLVRAKGKQIVVWDRSIEKGDKLGFEGDSRPCTAKSGRLRLKRTGTRLHYQWSPETSGNHFEEIHQAEFGDNDIARVSVVALTAKKQCHLDIRVADLRIRSSQPVPSLAAGAPEADAREGSNWRIWLTIALVATLLLGLGLVVRNGRRPFRRGGELTKEPTPFDAFTCSGCGKKLKVKAQLAGKLVKCPQCGQAVKVPEDRKGGPEK